MRQSYHRQAATAGDAGGGVRGEPEDGAARLLPGTPGPSADGSPGVGHRASLVYALVVEPPDRAVLRGCQRAVLKLLRGGWDCVAHALGRPPTRPGRPAAAARTARQHLVHSYIKTTLANLGTASDTKQHSIPAPSGAGFVASPAVAAPGFVDVAIVFARPTSRQATHPTRGFAKLNLTGLREEGLVAPPTPSQALVFPRRASPNDESKQKAPRPKPEMLANTPAYHLQQTETTTRKGRSVAWY